MTAALALLLLSAQPAAAAGNLTLPFADPHPRITSWTDHHYPDRQEDGTMIRFDGARGYAYDGHRGTDFAVPANTPVLAADEGTVIYSEWSDSGGWGVVIDHAYDRTAYFHNNRLFVYPGQHVSRGQLIALSGSTGNSTGPHVHFEVRDLLTPWHSVDPYGWTGAGADPWRWDMGYLWTSNPPVPFLLPLAFPGGARWDYWYGADGPPPPVRWQLRDGGHGLAGYAARWDADPGVNAKRSLGITGSAAVPGPGSHTLHLRVFDRTGASADITYLYLYDVEAPSSSMRAGHGSSTALDLHWTGTDSLSGIGSVSIDAAAGTARLRPWLSLPAGQSLSDMAVGGGRFLGEAGEQYRFRLTVKDAARNPAPPVELTATVPAGAAMPATAADDAVLGPLPAAPDGAAPVIGVRQEHPAGNGALLLGTDATLHRLGATPTSPSTEPVSLAPAVDVASLSAGTIRLLADGTTWTDAGASGPRVGLKTPVRFLVAGDGTPVAVDASGAISQAGKVIDGVRTALAATGATVVDAALFSGTHAGLALDSNGALHPFGGADPALASIAGWTLPGQADGLILGGSSLAPAGIMIDSSGDWQSFGSLLLLSDQTFGAPVFDSMTGLPVR